MARCNLFVGNDLKNLWFYFIFLPVWHNICTIVYSRKTNNTTIFFSEVFTMLDFNNNIFRTENVKDGERSPDYVGA